MVFLALCAGDTHAVVVDTKHGLGVDVVKTDGTGTGLGVADNVGDRLTNHPCKNLLLHQCQRGSRCGRLKCNPAAVSA